MAIVVQESGTDEGAHLWSEEIAWFGGVKIQDGKAKVGVLMTNCILRDRALEDLKTVPRGICVAADAKLTHPSSLKSEMQRRVRRSKQCQ